MKSRAKTQFEADEFEGFESMYQKMHEQELPVISLPGLEAVPIDQDSEGIIDDVRFLLTHDLRSQRETRQILRRAISDVASLRTAQ